MKKAREKYGLEAAEKIAKDIADAPKKAGVSYGIAVRAEAIKLNTDPIQLNGVSEMVPSMEQFARLPRIYLAQGHVRLPRDDMAKNLLALTKLDKADKPLQTGDPGLDKLNARLLKEKDFHQIQGADQQAPRHLLRGGADGRFCGRQERLRSRPEEGGRQLRCRRLHPPCPRRGGPTVSRGLDRPSCARRRAGRLSPTPRRKSPSIPLRIDGLSRVGCVGRRRLPNSWFFAACRRPTHPTARRCRRANASRTSGSWM